MSIPDSNGVIRGCYNPHSGNLRVVDSSSHCYSDEVELLWNQTGPQGPAGAPGPLSPFTTPVLDDFLRPAEYPLSDAGKWDTSTPWTGSQRFLSTNGQYAQGSSDTASSAWSTSYHLPIEVYCDLPAVNASEVILGWASGPGGSLGRPSYFVILQSGEWILNRSSDVINGGGLALSNGDGIGMMISESGLISVWHRSLLSPWTLLGSTVDTAFTGPGYLGVAAYDSAVLIGNFGGGTRSA